MPVLVLDDGTAIAETMAICRYFEETQAGAGLVRQGRQVAPMVEMWNRRMELGLLFSVAQAFRHLHPATAQLEVPQVPAWGEANKPRALEILQFMDEELGKRRFIAGDDYSVADITALVAIDFVRPAAFSGPRASRTWPAGTGRCRPGRAPRPEDGGGLSGNRQAGQLCLARGEACMRSSA